MPSLILPWTAGLGGKKVTPLTYSYGSRNTSGTNSSSYTFSSRTLGAAPAAGQRRYCLVFLTTMGNNSGAQSSPPNYCRANGVDMTLLGSRYDAGNGGTRVSMYMLEVSTGTTVSLSISLPGASGRCGAVIWAVYSDNNGAIHRETVSGQSVSTNLQPTVVNAGDVVLSGAANLAGGSAPTLSGGYMTRRGSVVVENTSYMSYADTDESTGISSPSITWDLIGGDSYACIASVLGPNV